MNNGIPPQKIKKGVQITITKIYDTKDITVHDVPIFFQSVGRDIAALFLFYLIPKKRKKKKKNIQKTVLEYCFVKYRCPPPPKKKIELHKS